MVPGEVASAKTQPKYAYQVRESMLVTSFQRGIGCVCEQFANQWRLARWPAQKTQPKYAYQVRAACWSRCVSVGLAVL
jgi:hypothetical protein